MSWTKPNRGARMRKRNGILACLRNAVHSPSVRAPKTLIVADLPQWSLDPVLACKRPSSRGCGK